MRFKTEEYKLMNCINRFFDKQNRTILRDIRDDLYRIDTYQLSEISQSVRKKLLKQISKLLRELENGIY